MKTVAAELAYFVRRQAAQNLRLLLLYCTFLATMVLGYALLFRYLMLHLEGREFSLIASIYWTITVMTTLGFGDITFHSDPGFLFATLVTISGAGCTVVALHRPGIPEPLTAPPPDTVLVAGTDLVLIGSPEQEKRFNQAFQ